MALSAADAYGCFMCAAAESTGSLPWTDEPLLLESGVGLVLPATGAIVPGYLLVCPERHLYSIARLSHDEGRGFARLVEVARSLLEETFGPTLMFEHGGCDGATPRSQCVAHAHLHLWAIANKVDLSVPSATTTYESLAAFLGDGARWASRPYLLYSGSGDAVSVSADHGEAQYFRRQIASTLGRPFEWDYGAFLFEEEMRETMQAVRRALRGGDK